MLPAEPDLTANVLSPEGVVLQRPAALDELAGIRMALRSWASKGPIGPETVEQLLVVMSEIVTNAIEASPPQSSVTVCWSIDGDHLYMSVEDQGYGFSYKVSDPVGPAAIRGRGLTVVEALSDRVTVTQDGPRTTVATWTRIRGSG